MRFISIDIETTGLDPKSSQLLSIGMTLGDTTEPIAKIRAGAPSFHVGITRPVTEVRGELLALRMNGPLIDHMTYDTPPAFSYENVKDAAALPTCLVSDGEEVRYLMRQWLDVNWGREPILFAGKNAASFDLPYLDQAIGQFAPRHHRVLDPTLAFTSAGDLTPPDLETCVERASRMSGMFKALAREWRAERKRNGHSALLDSNITAALLLLYFFCGGWNAMSQMAEVE
jgi:oligoribonuclease